MSGRRRVVFSSCVALVVLALVALAPAARATLAPPISIRWSGPPPDAAAGRALDGRFEIVAAKPALVEHLRLEGAGWTVHALDGGGAPAFLAGGTTRTVGFRATPADPEAPLVVHCTLAGRAITHTFRLGPAAVAKATSARAIAHRDGPPRLTRGPGAAGAQGQVIRFTGRFSYMRGDGVEVGADNIVVRVRDDDSPDPFDETIWEGTTDAQGYFDVTVTWDDCDISGCDDPDIYVEVIAASGQVDVQTDDITETTYEWSTQNNVINDFTGSEVHFGTMMPGDPAEHGAPHIYTSVTRAYRHAALHGGMTPPLVDVQWPDDDGSFYNSHFEEIHISPERTWNEVTHGHEFMHHLENIYSTLDDPDYSQPYCGPTGHCLWCPENVSDGWQEGVANWFGARVAETYPGAYGIQPWSRLNDSRYARDSLGLCAESGQYHPGAATEGYVMAFLRDVDDPNPTVDDHDGGGADCDMDAMALDTDEILAVIRLDQPDDVFQFRDAFRARFGAHDQDLWSTARNTDPGFGFTLPPPVVTSQPLDCRLVRAGESLTLQVQGNGALLGYRWQHDGVDLSDGGGVSGALTKTLTLSPATQAMSGVYACRVTTCDGTLAVTSLPARVTVEPAPGAQPLVSWGENFHGQIGDGTVHGSRSPRPWTGLTDIVAADGGRAFTLALKSNGDVYSWGNAQWGELGDGSFYSQRNTPYRIPSIAGAVQVATSKYHALALLRDGTVRGWGYGFYGLCGDGSYSDRSSPVVASAIEGCVRAIACGENHAIALRADGTVVAWGYNGFGSLGRGTTGGWSAAPMPVIGLTDVVAIAASGYSSLALRSDGTVWSWGWNNSGQLGNGTTTDSNVPVQVVGLSNVRAIAMGYSNGYAILNDGAVHAWGSSANGLIGDGQTGAPMRVTPVAVANLANAVKIDTGDAGYAMALFPDGTLKGWGYNYSAVLGAPSPPSTSTPQPVPGPSGIVGFGTAWATVHAFGTVTGVADAPGANVPARFAASASPNPARFATAIAFDLPAPGRVAISIYDVAGRRVRPLLDETREAGRHVTHWDGRATSGAAPLAGVYFARVEWNGLTTTQRIVRLP